jgi:uncharacterized membrane protein YkvA (DUF1232 family)
MSQDQHPVPTQPDDTRSVADWLRRTVRQARLVWRLFWDKRVSFWAKLIPPAALAYVVSPVDFLSDIPFLGFNQLDDLAVVLLGLKIFLELAPADVVREHLRDLGAQIPEWNVVEESEEAPGKGEASEQGRVKILDLDKDSG